MAHDAKPDGAPGEPPRVQATVDGRSARRLRTRASIIAALQALVLEGKARPTAESIAQRASVSVRSIYQHFADLDDLFTEFTVQSLSARRTHSGVVDLEANLEARIACVVQQRDQLYSDIAASARLAFALEGESTQVAHALRAIRRELRVDLSQIFAPELAQIDPAERDQRFEACSAILSFATYDLLRTREGLSRSQYLSTAQVALTQLLTV